MSKEVARLARERSSEIDKDLRREKAIRDQQAKHSIRILILGSSDSGKSTILKQLKILHSGGFTQQEIDFFKQVIYNNIWESTLNLLSGVIDVLKLPNTEKLEKLREQFLTFTRDKNQIIPQESLEAIHKIWKHPASKLALSSHRSNIIIDDNAEFFALKAKRYANADYIPTYDDILNARFATANVTEHDFTIEGKILRVIDVAGHKDLRCRWAPYLEKSLTAMIYVASINSFDQLLIEDRTINRMQDSMALFEKICANPYVSDVPVILFLNKMDLFEQKIKTSQISHYFPDYQDENTSKAGVKYFAKKFRRLKTGDSTFYMFCTTATSTSNMSKILAAVIDAITKKAIKESFNIA